MMQQKQRDSTVEDVEWTNQVADEMAKNPEQAIVFTKCFDWNEKILVTIGCCSHEEKVCGEKLRSQGARLHILASPELWDKPAGKGCLISWGSHVGRRQIR